MTVTDYETAKAHKELLSTAARTYLEYLITLEHTDQDFGLGPVACQNLWEHYAKSGGRQ